MLLNVQTYCFVQTMNLSNTSAKGILPTGNKIRRVTILLRNLKKQIKNMKKLIFMIIAAGLIATSALTSCKKDSAKAPTATSTTKKKHCVNACGGHQL